MKLSSKTRYGVRAVFDIAFHARGSAVQVKEIAERQRIPLRFLEQIFQDLKRAGIVAAKRGPRGGYRLAKSPDEISLGDVIRAVEGPIAIGASRDPEGGTEEEATSRAITESVFQEVSSRIETCLDAVSIETMCERGEALGMRRATSRSYVYVI